jgi:hypothetical protein
LSVNYTTNDTNITNDKVWYQWFLNGFDYIKGWGVNVVTFFFRTEDIGVNVVSVNASTGNETNSTYGNTITWTINVTQPILEPSELQPTEGTEVYDSIDIYCHHEYTGHTWFYDIDVMALQTNGSRSWQDVTSEIPTLYDWNNYDLTTYADFDNNLSVRCRTYNEYFGYSNFTENNGIIKKSLNQVKLYRPILSTIFIGQLTAFETDCDMSKSSKYLILDHFVDGNADGTYDKLMEYNASSNMNLSMFWYDTKFIISGKQQMSVGCIIQKKTTDAWDFSFCKETEQTCTIQNTYDIEVLP